jgi:hypothetical protein
MKLKLKHKPKSGLYRLNLTETELELIANLVYSVRLGGEGDKYKDAAFDLCGVFGEVGLNSIDLEEEMNFSVTPETEYESAIIEISEKEGKGCCGGCGCDCK